jgi:hypothetical protein
MRRTEALLAGVFLGCMLTVAGMILGAGVAQ